MVAVARTSGRHREIDKPKPYSFTSQIAKGRGQITAKSQ
jgi:hypothetical protein